MLLQAGSCWPKNWIHAQAVSMAFLDAASTEGRMGTALTAARREGVMVEEEVTV